MAYIDWEKPHCSKGKKMGKDEFSLTYYEKKNYCLTINNELSKKIKAKGFTHLNIKEDDITGEIGLEINYEKGLKMGLTGSSEKSFNYKISNKDWVCRLYKSLGLKTEERYVLKMSDNLSRLDKCMFFRIISNYGKSINR